jgi:hypothetical protein
VLTPEGKVKAIVRPYLRRILGAYVYSTVPTGYGPSTLDDLVCLDGRFVAIEYKAPGRIPTDRQNEIMKQVRAAKGIVAWGDDAEEIVRKITWEIDNSLRG